MPRNSDLTDIRKHIEVINRELGDVKEDLATINTNWSWMKWIIGGNVTLWVVVLGFLLKGSGI